jgi:hypothetical protein
VIEITKRKNAEIPIGSFTLLKQFFWVNSKRKHCEFAIIINEKESLMILFNYINTDRNETDKNMS